MSEVDTVAAEETRTDQESATEPERAIRCGRCDNPITSSKAVIEVDGLHEHVQANPAGVVFIFGCFKEAPGCDIIGEPTREHTWFPEYAWQFAMCDACTAHLGWYFRSSSDGFFGLILDRLIRD